MIDNIFDALSDVHRRRLLIDLLEHNPQDVTARASGSRADRTAIRMQHVHLPKLADYGYIEWGAGSGTVTKGPRFDEIRPVLEYLDQHREKLPELV
ncbi:helix-turn-helix transcriptional regulator [Halopiger djelfimassiliensis]|uniref:helix-turn-helix transcriptional regulator n=1 Tax=Halopiger djelfimassiliensis TaxID=1293047 RepID=UPI000677F9F2|nr:helix-turn-helix transcriptional regulator [Halopiger djelfimassiliensis]